MTLRLLVSGGLHEEAFYLISISFRVWEQEENTCIMCTLDIYSVCVISCYTGFINWMNKNRSVEELQTWSRDTSSPTGRRVWRTLIGSQEMRGRGLLRLVWRLGEVMQLKEDRSCCCLRRRRRRGGGTPHTHLRRRSKFIINNQQFNRWEPHWSSFSAQYPEPSLALALLARLLRLNCKDY